MTDFVNVYDLNRKKIAILQNAFTIKEEQQLNNIYTLSFNLPDTDAKLQYCQPFYYFRYGDSRQLYRRIRKPVRTGEDLEVIDSWMTEKNSTRAGRS